jgi:hypothetical protein
LLPKEHVPHSELHEYREAWYPAGHPNPQVENPAPQLGSQYVWLLLPNEHVPHSELHA